ncbi:MAG: NUDIX hydrolase [Candidatus Levybacteria bacterium]|nr:NUDIX hydrolase [Candidatus Levybacteria bacterium]
MIDCTFENGNKAQIGLRHSVVDVLVIDNNKILLVKRASHLLNGGKYALVGGFLERDEDTKEACKREVKEETGYESEPILLLRIAENPDRPQEDRQNVSFVYLAKAGEKIGEKDDENSEVAWFDLDKLPPKDQFAFDHYENIELYLRYLKEKFPLPVIGKI